MLENVQQDKEIIEIFEKELDKFIVDFKKDDIDIISLNQFFDKIIYKLKEQNLIDDTIFDIYQGKSVIQTLSYPQNDPLSFSSAQKWQKFYNFNRDIFSSNLINNIATDLKKASLKNKLYYSFAKLSEQLDLNVLSKLLYTKFNS